MPAPGVKDTEACVCEEAIFSASEERDGFKASKLHNSESESALFAKCVQTHEEFVVVFKKLLVHTCMHTYIHTYKHTYLT